MCRPGAGSGGTARFTFSASLAYSSLVLSGMLPRYLKTISRVSLTSKSPANEISRSLVSICDMTASLASSNVMSLTESTSIERNRSSFPVIASMTRSVVNPSRFFCSVSCEERNDCLLLPRASSSHLKPTIISRTTCNTASVPVIPSCTSSPKPTLPTFVVGKTKSTVRSSSLQLISTMSKWSTQNNSTCSRVHGPNAPPSCIVRAPIAIVPFLKPSLRSASRPPGATIRKWPR
mmetsp:Transcript_52317/g.78161  ORF Transcript_52317/g.78161 Transcript_52317/m.78161 type:complete len:234 (+) Transcript_52317:788-1489(+)